MTTRYDPTRPPWPGIRDQFDLDFDRWIFMDYLLLASPPRPVRDSIDGFTRRLREAPGVYTLDHFTELFGEVVEEAATYMGVKCQDPWEYFALTGSTTMGLGLIYNGIRMTQAQGAVTSQRAFMSTRVALRERDVRRAEPVSSNPLPMYREISLYRDPSTVTEDEIVDAVLRAVGADTRVLALTWVQSCTGVKLPIGRIGAAIAAQNLQRAEEERLLFCVDGVHGFAVETDDFESLHCDFFVSGCHKWLFGPLGTGFVCGQPDAWGQVSPTIASFMENGVATGRSNTPGGIHTYPYRWALAEAFRWHGQLGRDEVLAYTRALTGRLKSGLAAIGGVHVLTPMSPDLSASLVCCDVEGHEARSVVAKLKSEGIVATTSSEDAPYVDPPEHVRFSPSILTTLDEVDQTVAAVQAIAQRS